MPKYKIPVRYTNVEIIIVEANNAEQAMNDAIDNFGDFECIEQIDGDPEVNYHDIVEVK